GIDTLSITSTARCLPGNLTAIVGEELPGVPESEFLQHAPQTADTLFGRQRRTRAAHVGLHPAGTESNRDHAARPQVDRQALHHHVQRRLGAAVELVSPL